MSNTDPVKIPYCFLHRKMSSAPERSLGIIGRLSLQLIVAPMSAESLTQSSTKGLSDSLGVSVLGLTQGVTTEHRTIPRVVNAPPPSQSPSPKGGNGEDGLSTVMIIGIGVGLALLAVCLIALVVWRCKFRGSSGKVAPATGAAASSTELASY